MAFEDFFTLKVSLIFQRFFVVLDTHKIISIQSIYNWTKHISHDLLYLHGGWVIFLYSFHIFFILATHIYISCYMFINIIIMILSIKMYILLCKLSACYDDAPASIYVQNTNSKHTNCYTKHIKLTIKLCTSCIL